MGDELRTQKASELDVVNPSISTRMKKKNPDIFRYLVCPSLFGEDIGDD